MKQFVYKFFASGTMADKKWKTIIAITIVIVIQICMWAMHSLDVAANSQKYVYVSKSKKDK